MKKEEYIIATFGTDRKYVKLSYYLNYLEERENS